MMKVKDYLLLATGLLIAACGGTQQKKSADTDGDEQSSTAPKKVELAGPTFSADSAYAFCEAQCQFGPRTMNSEAHDLCGEWIAGKFRSYGLDVIEQRAILKGYDGTPLQSNNIIAQYRPELNDRILICAHWDSRPWADNDPDSANWHTPVMAANDGASGVAVMLELARLLSASTEAGNSSQASSQASHLSPLTSHPSPLTSPIGIDFICFDAEDWGEPQWVESLSDENFWALGAQYWAAHLHKPGYKARYGILLDMVGGRGARFYTEGYSWHYAQPVAERIWKAAETVGFSSFFPKQQGGAINDDHVPVNEVAHIPCVDIIHHTPQGGFGPTWHTVNDDMRFIDRTTLKAVGQTLVQVLFSE